MCLARQLLQALRGSSSTWALVHQAPGAGAGDGRNPGLRLPRLPPPGLGPRLPPPGLGPLRNLLFPSAGLLGADRQLTSNRRLEWSLPGVAARDPASYDLPNFRTLGDGPYPPILLEAMK